MVNFANSVPNKLPVIMHFLSISHDNEYYYKLRYRFRKGKLKENTVPHYS